MTRRVALRLALLLALLGALAAGTRTIAYIEGNAAAEEGWSLNGDAMMLRDPGGRLDVDAVAAAHAAGRFRAVAPRALAVGYTRDVLWLAVRLENPAAQPAGRYLVVGPPRLDDVQVHVADGAGGYLRTDTGLQVPVARRAIASRQLVAPLELPPGGARQVYVRVESGNAILLDLRLWEPLAFHYAERDVDLLNALQFGALLLFAVYAFIAAATTREAAFLYFGITLLAYGLYDVAILQYGLQHLWPDASDWAVRAPGVFLALVTFGLARVVAALLQTRERAPRWHRALLGLALAAMACLPGMLFADYAVWVQLMNYLSLALLVTSIGAIVSAFVSGVAGAGLLLGAFLLLWFTSLVRVGQILGLLPAEFLSEYSQGWSMVVGGMLMAVTLGQRVRRLAADQEAARARLVAAQVEARHQAEATVIARTRELQAAKEAAEASSRTKSVFIAQLSHELRTPLHSILGYSSLMAADAADPEQQRRLGAVQRSGRHLLALIDELLDYARGEAGRLALDPQPVALRELLESVAEETLELAHAQDALLVTRFAPDLPGAMRLDSLRLRQVLINLIANACRHSGARVITLAARAAPATGPGRRGLVLEVQDDGQGIAEADRERIFQPFERAAGEGPRPGMGLGLAISRQLVGLMGGTLTLAPCQPGSCFRVALEADEVELPRAAAPRPRAPRRYAGPVRRLLLVDDIAENLELLRAQLGSLGFETVCAGDAATALAHLEEGPVDAVLTDQLMPDIDGWMLLAEARRRGHGMPFVLVSAAPPQPPATGSPEPGFAATLMKPVGPERLAEVLGRCLGLAWRGEAVTVPPPPPSAAALARLRHAAEQGLVSDIEDWVTQVQVAEPEAGPFALRVREALRRMDLAGIARMAQGD